MSGGTIAPSPFVVVIGTIYLIGFAGQWLTLPSVIARFGLWPFLLVQAVMVAAWCVLHARRLRDAGRSTAPGQGIAVIYILAVVLLMLIGAFYMDVVPADGRVPESFLLVRELVTFSRGADVVTLLGLAACAALLVPPVFSLWAAKQSRRTV